MAVFDHWMKFNVGDYLADTMHLSTLQHGIYVLLIMHYFKHGSLPIDERELARIAKTSMPHWHRSAGAVLTLFKVDRDGTYRHSRIDSEREWAKEVSASRQAAGKAGASRRWSMANAMGADGKCHSESMANTMADSRARASTTTTTAKEPPRDPPVTGGAARTRRDKPIQSRNAAMDMLREDLTNDAEARDPPAGRSPVVPFPGRVIGHKSLA